MFSSPQCLSSMVTSFKLVGDVFDSDHGFVRAYTFFMFVDSVSDLVKCTIVCKFFQPSLSIHNFSLHFPSLFLSFNGASRLCDISIFVIMFGASLLWLMLNQLKSLLTSGFALSSCRMSVNTWHLRMRCVGIDTPLAWWPFHVWGPCNQATCFIFISIIDLLISFEVRVV